MQQRVLLVFHCRIILRDTGEETAPHEQTNGIIHCVRVFVVPHRRNRVAIERGEGEDAQRHEAALQIRVEVFVTHGETRLDALFARRAALQHIEHGLGAEFLRECGQISGRVGQPGDQFEGEGQALRSGGRCHTRPLRVHSTGRAN